MAQPFPLVEISYLHSHCLSGQENWFEALALPGASCGWRYRIDVLLLRGESSGSKSSYAEQYESYSFSLSGAKAAAMGQVPREVWPWVKHRLDSTIFGPWGQTRDFGAVLELENLHGSDWLLESIENSQFVESLMRQAKS